MDSLSTLWSDRLGLAPALTERACEGLARFGALRRYEPGDLPESTGAPEPRLHVVLNGWLADQYVLEKGERHVNDLALPGEAGGLASFVLAKGPYEIEAITPARAVALSRYDLSNMHRRAPEAAGALRTVLAALRERQRLRFFRRIVTLGRLAGDRKLCHLLCEITARTRPRDDELLTAEGLTTTPEGLRVAVTGEPDVLPISQRRLAELAGITPVHVNRVLRGLQQAMIVSVIRGRIVVLNPEALAATGQFDADHLNPESWRSACGVRTFISLDEAVPHPKPAEAETPETPETSEMRSKPALRAV